MKIRLKQPIIGYKQDGEGIPRIHADGDDILQVIFQNKTHFICDSKYYPEQAIIVFNSQCEVIGKTKEEETVDPHEDEKYYHVYEEKSNTELDDSLHTEFEFDDSD